MKQITYKRTTYYWNPFYGFFVQPVSATRKSERIIRSGKLYNALYDAAGQP
jgi:hypothetical protein